jgi:AraC family transcriptional regulator
VWADSVEQMREKYKYFAIKEEDLNAMKNNGSAALCVECGECLDKCPQMIDIPNELEKVHQVLGEGQELSEVYNLSIRGPVIVDKEEFQIVGVENIGKVETRNNGQVWAKFQELAPKVANRDASHGLGISMGSNELFKKGENRYIAANEVSSVNEVPEGMITETIPAQKYAVFTHIGKISNLKETYRYILEDWRKNNTRYNQIPFAPAFEWYDQRFDANSDDSELDLYIPIEEK